MIVYSKLFYGNSIGNLERHKIVWKLKNNKPLIGVYCLCLENNSPYLLEIMEPKEFVKEVNQHKKYKIIGIAKGKQEAFELVQRVIDFIYKKYGDLGSLKKEFNQGRKKE